MGSRGLGPRRSSIGLDEENGLLQSGLFDRLDECGSVVEALQIGPDLFDGGFGLVVSEGIQLVHVARVAEGDELRDPALVGASRQLVQHCNSQCTALRKYAHRTEAGLGQTTSEEARRTTRSQGGTLCPR